MSYEVEHEKWLKRHFAKRTGQRKDALKRGHGFGNQLFLEKVWWVLFGNFDGLHPEYELLDWRGYPFYADFIWSMGSMKFIFEIQDYGSHIQNMDRNGYRRELNRGMFMNSLQYNIIYISLDELRENPKLIIAFVQNTLSSYVMASAKNVSLYSKLEKDLMLHAVMHNRLLRPVMASKNLELDTRTIIKYMKKLVDKKKFRVKASGKSGRITQYEYIGSLTDPDIY